MRSNPEPARTTATAALVLALSLGVAGVAHAGLCGDASGDGYVTASDALKTLGLAVQGDYDRRADVVPDGGDGSVKPSDALRILKASVTGDLLPCRGAKGSRVVATTAAADLSSYGLAVVDVATHATRFRAASLSGDSVIRVPSGIPVVVNRQGSNSLQYLDVDAPGLPNLKECSVADGHDTNPQDVVFVSPHKGYVTPYGSGTYASGSLFVIDPSILFDTSGNPSCTGIITKKIDLSSYDPDGVPDMDQMALLGSDLYVSLQKLDLARKPVGPGLVVVIDTTTDTVKATIPLHFADPFAATKGLPYDEFQGLLFAGGPGWIEKIGVPPETLLDDGGIEAIDPKTNQSAGMLVTGADLHANIFDFVVVGTKRIFAITADTHANSVVDIDLAKKKVTTLLSSQSFIIDIELNEAGELWVAYRGETKADPPGLRIFRVSDDSERVPMIPLGQAPYTIAFLD